jgi:drug/metabolite transporter (DMT)-like permease
MAHLRAFKLKSLVLPELSPLVLLAMLAVYGIWSVTYLGIAMALESFPPYLMGTIRFTLAGWGLFLICLLNGAPVPTWRQWRHSFYIGALLTGGGQGGVAFAEQYVASGLAALVGGTIPLWAALFAWAWGRRPTGREWFGLALGALGIIILNSGAALWAEPIGALVLFFSPIFWAFGSIWSRKLDLPHGLMRSATMMIGGSMTVGIIALLRGEALTERPTQAALLWMGFLIIFGSMVAFSAYAYLLAQVRPAVATSYAYVNPVLAILVGALFNNEAIHVETVLATLLIIPALVIITTAPAPNVQKQDPPECEA